MLSKDLPAGTIVGFVEELLEGTSGQVMQVSRAGRFTLAGFIAVHVDGRTDYWARLVEFGGHAFSRHVLQKLELPDCLVELQRQAPADGGIRQRETEAA